MTIYSEKIRAASTKHYRSGKSDTSALDLQAVAGEVADAVEFLESLQRGAKILFGTTAPDLDAVAAAAPEGDAYINRTTSDLFEKDATGWVLMASLRGKDGKTPVRNVDFFDGRTPQKGTDYNDGAPGKSAYQLYQAAGGQLSSAAWLASLKAKDGEDGAPGNKTRWESVAPAPADAGAVGDTWYFAVAADKVKIYECYRTAADAAADVAGGGQWRLRYTSPDAPAATVVTQPTGGSTTPTGTTNGVTLQKDGAGTKYLADDGQYKAVQAGSSLPAQSAATTGKALVSDGTAAAWQTVKAGTDLPEQVAGRVLGTNGTALQWVSATSVPTASRRTMPMVFSDDANYENGSLGAPLNGPISIDHTGAVRGCTVGLYHRDSAAPQLPAECELIGGGYLAGRVNFFAFTYEGPSLILYTVTQRP